MEDIKIYSATMFAKYNKNKMGRQSNLIFKFHRMDYEQQVKHAFHKKKLLAGSK